MKRPFAGLVQATVSFFAVGTQEQRAHHGCRRQRYQHRYGDGEGKRDGKLVKQAADDAAHHEDRNEDGDQRYADGDYREADLLGALERRLQRRYAPLQMAGDVLDDDDGIVNHKTGGDGQRHERQIVDAVAEQVHSAEGADQ